MRKLNSNHGMTLVEVLTAVAILVIVAAVAFPRFQDWWESTQKAVCDANLADMQQQLDSWQIKYRETWAMLNANAKNDASAAKGLEELSKMLENYHCPEGGTYAISSSGIVYCSNKPSLPVDQIVAGQGGMDDNFNKTFLGIINTNKAFNINRIDSTSASQTSADFLEAMENSGINPAAAGVKTWAMIKEGNTSPVILILSILLDTFSSRNFYAT